MTPAVEIVRYRREHEPLVARLQTLLWSYDPALNARYLKWKYELNPWAGDVPRIYLAVQGDHVIGMRGFFPSRWEIGSSTIEIPLADDLTVRPESRNKGLVTRIMQTALEDLAASGFEYVFSLSAGLLTTIGSLSMGWKSAGRYEPWMRRYRPPPWQPRMRERLAGVRVLWRLSDTALLQSADERAPFRRFDRAGVAGPGIVSAAEPQSEAMARLIAELGHDGRLRHVRTAQYLAWRFANPLAKYRFLYAGGREGLDGYLVLKCRAGSPGHSRVWISDLEGRSAQIRAGLLATAVEAGAFHELLTWTSTLQPEEREALAKRGFELADPYLKSRGCPCVLVRSTRDVPPSGWTVESRALLDPANWDLRMLYSMSG